MGARAAQSSATGSQRAKRLGDHTKAGVWNCSYRRPLLDAFTSFWWGGGAGAVGFFSSMLWLHCKAAKVSPHSRWVSERDFLQSCSQTSKSLVLVSCLYYYKLPLAAWARDPFGITKAIKNWKRKMRKDNAVFCQGREQADSAMRQGGCQKSHRGTFRVRPHRGVNPGCEPGFIAVPSHPHGCYLLWFWKCPINVQRLELGLKLFFCSGRRN